MDDSHRINCTGDYPEFQMVDFFGDYEKTTCRTVKLCKLVLLHRSLLVIFLMLSYVMFDKAFDAPTSPFSAT